MTNVTFDDLPDLADVLVVFFFGLFAHARGFAAPDVKFEAGPEFSFRDILLAEVVAAGSEWIGLADEVQYSMHELHGGIGTKILTAILYLLSRIEQTGEPFFLQDDPGIGLIVAEVDIVAGTKAFNKV